jgi:hypothetical protein
MSARTRHRPEASVPEADPLHDVVAVERVVAAARRSSVLERSTRWLRLLLIALAVILRGVLAGIGTSVF